MKIESVDVFHFNMNGAAGIPRWNPIFVRVNTSEGISGIGEVGLAYGVARAAALNPSSLPTCLTFSNPI